MKNHKIIVTISEEGATARIEGIPGHGCEELDVVLGSLAEALGTPTEAGTTDDWDKKEPKKQEQTWEVKVS